MSRFDPTYQDLCLFRAIATEEYRSLNLPLKLRGAKKPLDGDEVAVLANLRAALKVLNKLGAVKEEWIQRCGVDDA